MPISRRHVFGLLGLLPGLSCQRQDDTAVFTDPRRRVADVFSLIPPGQVQLRGAVGRKVDLCVHNRILQQDPNELVEPFRHRHETSRWQTEFWGKWFLSAAAACRYTGDAAMRDRIGTSVPAMMATQDPDGYIGNYEPGYHLFGWDIWGRKYTLLGLLAWHNMTGDAEALKSARRLADHLLYEVGPRGADIVRCGLYRGMASSSVLEPIVLLYRRTGDERYLDFAEYIVGRWSSHNGPQLVEKALAGVPVGQRFPPPPPNKWFSWENGQKAYEMMSCYTGLIELYRETGRAKWLQAAVKTFESIRATEINIAGSGASRECWYGGAARQTQPAPDSMETCVTVTWMQFCGQLLRATGDAHYADEIERTVYNALFGSMTPDGAKFAQYTGLEGTRKPGGTQCDMSLNCCTANGPRGLMFIPELAVMTDAEGPVFNLYIDGAWNLKLPTGFCSLDVRTDYPRTPQIDITVKPDASAQFPLRLRIPAWSAETVLNVNGEKIAVQPGTYAVLRRTWKPGDRVHLELDLRGRLVHGEGAGRFLAVTRGPLVLARDTRLGPDPIDSAGKLTDADGNVVLQPSQAPEGIDLAFTAGNVRLCDYASAGNTWDDRSHYRVWMNA